jgi:hypothetical protein
MIVNSSMGGSVASTSHPMTMGSHLWSNAGPSGSSGASNAPGGVAKGAMNNTSGSSGASQGTFLLSQLTDEQQSDDCLEERKRRGFFVEEIVLASLAANKTTTSTTSKKPSPQNRLDPEQEWLSWIDSNRKRKPEENRKLFRKNYNPDSLTTILSTWLTRWNLWWWMQVRKSKGKKIGQKKLTSLALLPIVVYYYCQTVYYY